MQEDPVYDDVVSDVKRFLEERLAFAVARRDRRAERLPRSGDRLREDGCAQLRARAPPRRAVRARPAGADRPLAQEQPRRSSSAVTRVATRRRSRSAPRSPPTIAARRSCACTTCASTSRRWPRRRRCAGDRSSCTGCTCSAITASRRRRSGSASSSCSTWSSRWVSVVRTTGSRTRSTTREVASAIRELSNAHRFDLLEALATATADLALRTIRTRARARTGPQAAGQAGRHDGRVQRGHRRTPVTLAYVGLGLEPRRPRGVDPRSAAELIGAARLSPLVETEPWGYRRPAAVPERGR